MGVSFRSSETRTASKSLDNVVISSARQPRGHDRSAYCAELGIFISVRSSDRSGALGALLLAPQVPGTPRKSGVSGGINENSGRHE